MLEKKKYHCELETYFKIILFYHLNISDIILSLRLMITIK